MWGGQLDMVLRITPACAGSTDELYIDFEVPRDHPRLRGEHPTSASSRPGCLGSPPPARGAHQRQDRRSAVLGITPACAGSTTTGTTLMPSARDHPRLRGEHDSGATVLRDALGSPPPARGARDRRHDVDHGYRITPACAGSTLAR